MDNDNKSIEIWNKVLKASLSIPGAKIDRTSFLTKELSKRVSETQMQSAIESNPAKAGIPRATMDEVAKASIKWHLTQVTSISFLAGLPGGWWMAGTIPADLAQFYWHVIQVVQKLAYIYGWPELYSVDEIDDETLLQITLFIGVMMGAKGAAKIVSELAERVSAEVAKRLPRAALTKYGIYTLAKQVAKWIGVKLTKDIFSRIASKIVPILGGAVSGAISYVTMKSMSRRLSSHLRSLAIAGS
jgi:uncharacterized membrane protein